MKLKTKKELLADFKKANKTRKLYLANRAGFDTSEDYLNHLIKQVEVEDAEEVANTPEQANEDLVVHVVNILDVSYSMEWDRKLSKALAGLNLELSNLKSDKSVEYFYSLVTFSSSIRIKNIYTRMPIVNVNKVEASVTGNTALFDALGNTLSYLLENKSKGEKVVVKIFTDGQENDSRVFTQANVANLILECKKNDITVTFVGTKEDVVFVQRKLNIDETNTLVHNNTAKGVADSFNITAQATRSYVAKAKAGEDTLVGFYKQSGTL